LIAGREPDLPEEVVVRRVPVVTAEVEPVPPERAGRAGGAAFRGSEAAPVSSSSPPLLGGSVERNEESMM
jgi:hypothetical protein